MADVFENLVKLALDVERVCRLLESPTAENLDRCPLLLQQACAGLAGLKPSLAAARGDAAVEAAARRVRFAAVLAARLLENAREYHGRWSRILGGMTGGYDGRGDPAALARPGRICLTG